MYCPHCGKELAGAPKFCIYCGHALEKEKQQGSVPDKMAQPVSEAQEAAPKEGAAHVPANATPVKGKAQAAASGKRRGRRFAALCAAIVLVAGVAIGGYWGYRQYQVHSLCEEAGEARAQWRVQDAARAWRQALALQPECTEAYLGLSELSCIFSNTTNAILILNDGLTAGADSAELNRALDELCGPDITEHTIFSQISLDNFWPIFSCYSRNGNRLYQTDAMYGIYPSEERQISPEDDILRPSSFARGDGTVTRTYDALGLVVSESYSEPEYTQGYEWTNDSETGLPLSCRVTSEIGGTDGAILQTLYEYTYTDGRLTSIVITYQGGLRGEEPDYGEATYLFDYSGTPTTITVTAAANSFLGAKAQWAGVLGTDVKTEDYLVELDEHGFLSKKQPLDYNDSAPMLMELSYNSDGQLAELSVSDGTETEFLEIHYDEKRHVSGMYAGEKQICGPLFPEE